MTAPRYLGRYEVIDLIARGGMGSLYRARDPLIGRHVAIKLLRAGLNADEFRERFTHEARSAGSLNHPNIVTIYDLGEYDGLPFIAMEYVRGDTFADLIRVRPPLPLERKLQLIDEVCAGLAHAHEAGIVHRDIKPANLIVGAEGTVKILDFGIAKVSASGITSPGAIIGTLNYMSPEQLLGQELDARADLFSLGAVLYEFVSHQPAFAGTRLEAISKQILSGTVTAITDYCPDLDPRLVRLIDQLLEKDRDDRPNAAADVRRALAAIRAPALPSVAGSPRLRTPPPPSAGPSVSPIDTAAYLAQRDARVEALLARSEQEIAAGDFEAALDACKQVLLLDASEERAILHIARVHAQLDRQRADAELDDAHLHLESGELTLARHAIEAAETLCPAHPGLARLRRGLADAEAARSRADAIAAAADSAHRAFAQQQFELAMREADRVLALDPQQAGVRSLREAATRALGDQREEARLRGAIEAAKATFDRGDHEAALGLLDALPAAPAQVAETVADLRGRWTAIQEQRRQDEERAARQRTIAAAEADAGRALAAGRFADVRAALDTMREADPAAPALAPLAAQLAAAEEAVRVRQRVDDGLRAVELHLAQGQLDEARAVIDEVAALVPSDSGVRAGRQRVETALTVRAAQEAAEARAREADQKLQDAEARLEGQELTSAGGLIAAAAALVPDHPRLSELRARLTSALDQRELEAQARRRREEAAALIRSAWQRSQSAPDNLSELSTALWEVAQARAVDAGNAEAATLQTSIEAAIARLKEDLRIATAIDNARRRFANGKHQAAIQLLEQIQPSTHPSVAAALEELRAERTAIEARRQAERERAERETRIAALIAAARSALAASGYDDALAHLAAADETESGRADVADVTAEVRQARHAAEITARRDHLMSELEVHMASGALDRAEQLLASASEQFASDGRFAAAGRRLESAIADRAAASARAAECDDKVAAAESALADGKLDAARELLEQVRTLDPRHVHMLALLADVDRAIADRQAAALAEQHRIAIESLLDAAERQLDLGPADLPAARHSLTEALQRAPDSARARTLKARLDAAMAAAHETARIQLEIGNARARFASGKHQAALGLLERLEPSTHPEVADVLSEMRAALAARLASMEALDTPPATDAETVVVARPTVPTDGRASFPAPASIASRLTRRFGAGEFGPWWTYAAAGVLLAVATVTRC